MTQVAIDDRLIEKARKATTLDNDQEIVEAALDGLIFEIEAHREEIRLFEEMKKEPGYVGWDPEFAGWDKRDIK
jgi:Arc/MetJ family transcription regulator